MSLPKAKPALPSGFLFCPLTSPQKAKVKLSFYSEDDAAYPDIIDVVVMHQGYTEEN